MWDFWPDSTFCCGGFGRQFGTVPGARRQFGTSPVFVGFASITFAEGNLELFAGYGLLIDGFGRQCGCFAEGQGRDTQWTSE